MKHIITFFALLVSLASFAQPDSTTMVTTVTSAPVQKRDKTKQYPKNIVKMSVTSLLFKNYHFIFERSLSRKITASVGYRTMPATALGSTAALKQVYKLGSEDEDAAAEDWNDIRAANKTISAEVRFYSGRKQGPRGFYVALHGRYATFDVDYDYQYEADNKTYAIPIVSTAKGVGGGLYIGAQWLIGKRVAIDWQILGGQWGKLTGSGTGTANLSALTAQDKEWIKDDIESVLPTIGDKAFVTAQVDNSGVRTKTDGPFAGLRSGISIGIAF